MKIKEPVIKMWTRYVVINNEEYCLSDERGTFKAYPTRKEALADYDWNGLPIKIQVVYISFTKPE